jgi:hypothetical protein
MKRSVHKTGTCVEGQYFEPNQGQESSTPNGPGTDGDADKRQRGDSVTIENGLATVNMGPSAVRDDGYEVSAGV